MKAEMTIVPRIRVLACFLAPWTIGRAEDFLKIINFKLRNKLMDFLGFLTVTFGRERPEEI